MGNSVPLSVIQAAHVPIRSFLHHQPLFHVLALIEMKTILEGCGLAVTELIQLIDEDHSMISNRDWLSDNIISWYQHLLKKKTENSFWFTGSHWVAISTVGYEKGKINWFDSLYYKPSLPLKK